MKEKISDLETPSRLLVGDIPRGGWTGLDSLDSVKVALSRLVDLGWIRQITLPTSMLGGRPSIRYQVYPKILSKTPA